MPCYTLVTAFAVRPELKILVHTDDFDYNLPSSLIAQHPAEPRDSCRLLVLDRKSLQIDHRTFSELPEYLSADDLLVVNDTRVLPARLNGTRDGTGGAVEVLLLRERYENAWECLVRPGRKMRPGSKVVFGEGLMTGLVVEQLEESGVRVIQFTPGAGARFLDVVHEIGKMPLPPYITEDLGDPEEYQTIFAREERSAAAPTAGLHFTPELMQRIRDMGVGFATVELDVGLDTFRPVSEDDPRDHPMHTERFRVSQETVDAVRRAKAKGGRVIAVGTTSVRALESAWDEDAGGLRAIDTSTRLFILPGYSFRVVDAMVTNFHVPRSTLMMMVSAFAGRDTIMRAYNEAVEKHYRFLSFGDAMLIA